jgi:hypothetical protein
MNKLFFIIVLFTLFLSGCQPIPILLATPSAAILEFTNTPEYENTESPKRTVTSIMSSTASLTSSPTSIPLPTTTPTALPISMQTGSPVYIQNFAHTDESCNWLGIAGQIFDAKNQTLNNLVINVRGLLDETEIDLISVTGIPEADVYGPGGYEIKIADSALKSEKTLTIQVFDINGNIMSIPISFNTFSDCDKNLVIINFQLK